MESGRVAEVDLGCDFPEVHGGLLVLVSFLEELAEVDVQLLKFLLGDGLAHFSLLAAFGLPLQPLRLGLLLLRTAALLAGLFLFKALVVEILEVQVTLLLLNSSLFGGACIRREGRYLLESFQFLEICRGLDDRRETVLEGGNGFGLLLGYDSLFLGLAGYAFFRHASGHPACRLHNTATYCRAGHVLSVGFAGDESEALQVA